MEERNKTSWKVAATYKRATHVETRKTEDHWRVDRMPPVGTRTAKVSYGEIKVVVRHGKK